MQSFHTANQIFSSHQEVYTCKGDVYYFFRERCRLIVNRDDVRYNWKHAILPLHKPDHIGGQRVSVIIRVYLSFTSGATFYLISFRIGKASAWNEPEPTNCQFPLGYALYCLNLANRP